MAVAAAEHGIEPRRVSFTGAKQAVTAFAPKIEAARPQDRPALIDALLTVIPFGQFLGEHLGVVVVGLLLGVAAPSVRNPAVACCAQC
jgi:hypothetical protein